jgi:hypothetical protein
MVLTFSFGRPKEKGNKKKNRRLKTEAGICGFFCAIVAEIVIRLTVF